MLVTEGGTDLFGNFININFFSYESLRRSFMKSLLDLIAKDEYRSFTCKKCGFSEDTPTWVIDEQMDMDLWAGADKSTYIPTTVCIKCNGTMIPTEKITK